MYHVAKRKLKGTMTEAEKKTRTIRLHIYDDDITVTVPQEDEPLYRKDAELINELLNAYYATYKGRKGDMEITYFAMIDLGLRLQRELLRNDTKPYDDILAQLTSEIETELKQK